jgi:sugar phosphate isomerase/epimerase
MTSSGSRTPPTATPPSSLNRREFVGSLGSALGAFALLPRPFAAPRHAIGIQLYTVRTLMAKDAEGTLAALAQIGYREVELAGMYDKTAAELRAMLDRHQLAAPAGHIALPALRGDALKRTLENASTLGHRYVVCPWIDQADRTADGYKRIAEEFTTIGEAARAAGMQFCYHNHDFEFAPLVSPIGRDGYDILLGASEPTLVRMELDLYWVTNANRDPLEYFDKYPGRFPLVHVKDRRSDGTMAEVGQGYIDFKRIFARGERAGIRHYFVEHDQPLAPLESAKQSFEYLSRMKL